MESLGDHVNADIAMQRSLVRHLAYKVPLRIWSSCAKQSVILQICEADMVLIDDLSIDLHGAQAVKLSSY
jgi:hypothetical protein